MDKKQCQALTHRGLRCPHREVLCGYCVIHFQDPKTKKMNEQKLKKELEEKRRKEEAAHIEEEFYNYAQ